MLLFIIFIILKSKTKNFHDLKNLMKNSKINMNKIHSKISCTKVFYLEFIASYEKFNLKIKICWTCFKFRFTVLLNQFFAYLLKFTKPI